MTNRLFSRLAFITPLALPLFAGISCGGAAPEPKAAKPEETKPAPPAQPDVSAVPKPATLLVFGRFAKPADLLQVASGWSGSALPPNVVTELVADAPVSKAADLAKPVDFAVAIDPSGHSMMPGLAASVAVRPLDESRPILEKSFTLKPGKDGIVRLEPKRGDDDDDEGGHRRCALYPSADAPLRLVCGTSRSALETLGPYLSRTSPRASYPADVHVEITPEPVRSILEGARPMLPMLMGNAIGLRKEQDPATFSVVSAMLGDVVDFAIDLSDLQFDAKLADPGAEGTLTANFKGTTSLAARLATSHPERTDAPPATFWRMPAGSDAVFFHRGIDEKDIAHARTLALDAVSVGLTKAGFAEADKSAVKNLVTHASSLLVSPAVYAKGVDVDAAQKAVQLAINASKEPQPNSDETRAAGAQLAGWSIISLEQPIAAVSSVAKESASVLARPALTKRINVDEPGVPAPTFKQTPSKQTATLPKGTLHFELTVVHAEISQVSKGSAAPPAGKGPPKKAPPPKTVTKLDKPVKLHVFLVPDGARTLVGTAIDEALAAKMLAGVIASATTLDQREALADLKRAKLGAGGFLDARAILEDSPLGYLAGRHARPADPFRALGQTPSHGSAPIPLALIVQPSKDGNAGTFVATTKVSKAAIQDLIAALLGTGS